MRVYDSKLIARFAFALFTYGVTTRERCSDKIVKPQPWDSELLDAAKIVLKWNLSQEINFTVPDGLWPKIMEFGKRLDEIYGCEDIPLLLRANPYKLACVAYPFALVEGLTEPTERHVKLAYEWLNFCAEDIELDKYVEWWMSQHELGEGDYASISVKLQEEIDVDVKEHGGGREEACVFKFIEYLVKNEKGQRDEIAAHANVEHDTISRKARLLKGLGLLKSDKDGHHFTAKDVRFFRRWSEEDQVAHLAHASTSESHTLFQSNAGNAQNVPVTPKSSRMSGISRIKTEPVESLTPETGDMSDINVQETHGTADLIDKLRKLVVQRDGDYAWRWA